MEFYTIMRCRNTSLGFLLCTCVALLRTRIAIAPYRFEWVWGNRALDLTQDPVLPNETDIEWRDYEVNSQIGEN